jgi:hypothetical protein
MSNNSQLPPPFRFSLERRNREAQELALAALASMAGISLSEMLRVVNHQPAED